MYPRRDVGKQTPKDKNISVYCNILNKTVNVEVSELIDGWPPKTIWKQVKYCSCNAECNPSFPNKFPKRCPALKVEIKKT